MTNFNIKERQVGDVTVLDMVGKMQIGESGILFCKTIRRLLEEGRRHILLNLKGVTHIDSSGLGELIASFNTLNKKDGQVKLLHLTKRIRELMTLTKLLTVFEVYENESEALNSFQTLTLDHENHSPTLLKEAPLGSLPVQSTLTVGGLSHRVTSSE
jgi:anti-sigma B factor antagonist